MTSLQTSIRQNNDGGYFINLASLESRVLSYNAAANSFSTAAWATNMPINSAAGGNRIMSSLATAGAGILKDMGKTVVSSLRTFRKVQLNVPVNSTLSTFGVGGRINFNEDYYTGYIELGLEGNGTPAPVARVGR
jgi:hypothetical protein